LRVFVNDWAWKWKKRIKLERQDVRFMSNYTSDLTDINYNKPVTSDILDQKLHYIQIISLQVMLRTRKMHRTDWITDRGIIKVSVAKVKVTVTTIASLILFSIWYRQSNMSPRRAKVNDWKHTKTILSLPYTPHKL
jgi:hypothetical protein